MSPGTGAHSAPAPDENSKTRTTAEEPARPSMFSSLRIRNYRLFAMGQLVSNTGTWMQRIAQDWLVLSITGSATAVGITTALQFLPMLLLGLYGGVIADRYAKRRLLLITQTAMGLTGLALAALTLSGQVQVWHVYALALVLGLATVVDNPARQTFVSEMVGPEQLPNAVSLNSANFQSARLIGPAVAGVLITAVGSGWAFLLNGLSFLAPIAGLLLMRSAELHVIERAPRTKGQLREGLRYVRSRPELIWPITLVGFVGTFGFNFPIWLSAFTDKVFEEGAGTYGMLNTLMAVGSVTGALLAARRGTSRMRIMVGAALLFGVLEVTVALSPSFWLFAALMVPLGVVSMTFIVTANSSIQLASDPAMRGRVMSLYMMVFLGGTPIGAPVVGWVTDAYGARIGLLSGGLVSALAAVASGLVLARISGLRPRIELRHGRRRMVFVPVVAGPGRPGGGAAPEGKGEPGDIAGGTAAPGPSPAGKENAPAGTGNVPAAVRAPERGRERRGKMPV
ncbi:MFS transporter [Streptomyces carminius]|uniref:MFS transporter n=1 Tax=Streptomyces carminius TaxID=2665496 RepID=A0A2M8M093_9ACTN|nr:MFS transporter [Streptomyces carminius]PJE97620.1 MFS transporter [Streptomyces carminius]